MKRKFFISSFINHEKSLLLDIIMIYVAKLLILALYIDFFSYLIVIFDDIPNDHIIQKKKKNYFMKIL